MNLTQLNAYFDTVFNAQRGKGISCSKSKVGTDITFESRTENGIYRLCCTVSGNGVTARRIKYFGTNAPAEIPFEAEAIAAYYLAKMDTVYNALPHDTQATFALQYVAVKDFVKRGKGDVAKTLVQNTAVPSELEAAKASILALL